MWRYKQSHHGTTLSTAAKLQDKCMGMGSSQVQVRVRGLGAASYVYLVIVNWFCLIGQAHLV